RPQDERSDSWGLPRPRTSSTFHPLGLPFFRNEAYHRHAWRSIVPARLFYTLILLAGLVGCTSVDADRWRIFNEEGVTLYAQGNYRQALENFDYALTLHSQDPILIFNMAQCYDRLGDPKRAEQYYAGCLQLDPKHADARLALIELRYRAGKIAEANRMIQDWA